MSGPVPYINININIIKVNSFENASAINVGQNLLADWHNSDKKKYGFRPKYGRRKQLSRYKKFCR
jgi:hypothetical protein